MEYHEYKIEGKRVEDIIVLSDNKVTKTTPYFRYMTGWGLPRLMQYILNNRMRMVEVNVRPKN
jgi:hypothetical protein